MHRLTVWLIAIVFVFNGAASLAWTDLPAAPVSIVESHGGVAAAVRHEGHLHDIGDEVVATASDHDQPAGHTDNCLKCCGTCSVTNMVPDVVVSAVTFASVAVKFQAGQNNLVGHLVALDPDIPKILV